MSNNTIPTNLRNNALTKVLDAFRRDYCTLSRGSLLHGILIADQDAKVLSVNSFFDHDINYWDIGAIGAALYGVSKQGKDFFNADELERATLIYKETQFFVHSIGTVSLAQESRNVNSQKNGKKRELILILIGNKKMNIGLAIMQMRKYAPKIKQLVEEDERSQDQMQMSEKEFMGHIADLKRELFNLGSGGM